MRRVFLLAAAALALAATAAGAAEIKLLNVSYDPTRELYKDLSAAFANQWKAKTGDTVILSTSNGGSGACSSRYSRIASDWPIASPSVTKVGTSRSGFIFL